MKPKGLVISGLCLLAVLSVLPHTALAVFANWATINRADNWNPIYDDNGENSLKDYQDISSDGPTGGYGTWASANVGSDGTTTGNVYFRILLNNNPLSQNSQGVWEVNNNTGVAVFLDTSDALAPTSASVQNWCIQIGKTGTPGTLMIFNGTSASADNPLNVLLGAITENGTGGAGTTWTDSTGYMTVTDTGAVNQTTGADIFTVDITVPFSWFEAGSPYLGANAPITLNTPVRAFCGTSTEPNTINKDYFIDPVSGRSALDFTETALFTFGNPGVNGFLFDTRDTNPPGSGGTWHGGDTLTVNAYGFPWNAALTVQVYDPAGATKLWSGTITTNGSGEAPGASLLTIPISWTPGVYRINVVDPVTGVSNYYDSFTVSSPNAGITKTVSPAQTIAASPVTYTITLTNPATPAGTLPGAMTTLTDTLPAGFTYKPGSTAGLTASDPAISGQTLTWSGAWTLAVGGTETLSFQAITPNTRGTFTNRATAAGTNFGPVSTGNTASLLVLSPIISLSKSADKSSAPPGAAITYTITYQNIGDAPAYTLVFLDNVPAGTTYVTGSAQGAGTTIQYSHDGGVTWNGSDAAPVTGVKWTLSPLAAGAGGTLGYKTTVN